MAPFRIARPRFLAYFALEGGLILSVLYGLANLTLLVAPVQGQTDPAVAAAAIGALFCVILLGTQRWQIGDRINVAREIVLFSVISLVIGLVCFAVMWVLLGNSLRLSTLLLLEGAVAVPAAVALWRWASVRLNVMSGLRERVLIVGTTEIARQVGRWITTHHGAEYAVVGFADDDPASLGRVLAMGARVQTDYDSLARFAPCNADRVIVALEEKRGKLPVEQLMELRLRGVEVEEATSFFERIGGKIPVETMLPSWLIFSDGFKTSALRCALKRTADLVLATVLLVLTAPLMLLTALLIRLDSPGPVLYRQKRCGRHGHEFEVLKFRSMREDAEKSGPTWASQNDPRVTRVGAILRKLRIDELPQLFNVLRGEMSFVGPRPERAHFVQQLEEKIPYFALRMTARPGITGWAQVEYRYGASEEDSREKLKYDLFYIKNSNLLFDLWIVLKTVKVVLCGSGAR